MGVYIKNMKMPKEGTVIAIYKLNGKFYASMRGTELCPLVSVPKHGRLIDADALREHWAVTMENGRPLSNLFDGDCVFDTISEAPTIIEAEAEE